MRDYVSKLSSHLHSHGQYDYILESFYLECTESYYTNLSAELAQSLREDPNSFVKQAGVWIEDETQRAKDVLLTSSWGPVREVTLRALLGNRLEWLAGGLLSTVLFHSYLLK
jgi:hypothetical protein